MPTAVACPKCQKKYALPDTMLGKPVKCQKCGARFQVGKPAAAGAGQAAQQQPRPKPPAQNPALLEQMGVGAPLQKQADLFSMPPSDPRRGDPLGNHVVHDPGFGDVTTRVRKSDEDENELADLFSNPELAPKKKRKSKGDPLDKYDLTEEVKVSDDAFMKEPWFIIFAVLAVFCFGAYMLHMLTTNMGKYMCLINVGILMFINMIVSLWSLYKFFKSQPTGLEIALFFLVPMYPIYYMIVKWDEMHHVVKAMISLFIMSIVVWALFFVFDGPAAITMINSQ